MMFHPDYAPDDGVQYDKELFQEKFFVYADPGDGDYYEQELFQVLLFRQTRGEIWSNNLKEMQHSSFQNYNIIVLSQMLHNMSLSL